MTMRIQVLAVTALTVVSLTISMDRLGAQEPAATKSNEPVSKKKHDVARRVPAYFGQIGLTSEQRANIYGIQTKRYEKIEALEQQIAIEKAEMLAQCENTLTEIQKKLLDNLRRAAAEPNGIKTADGQKPVK